MMLRPVFFCMGTRQRMRHDREGLQNILTTYLFLDANPNSDIRPLGLVILPSVVLSAVVDEINRRHQISTIRTSSVSWEDVRAAMGLSPMQETIILTSAENAWTVNQLVLISVRFHLSTSSYIPMLFHHDWPLEFLLGTIEAFEIRKSIFYLV